MRTLFTPRSPVMWGTVGMLLAWLLRKRLLVRHCGNWGRPKTKAEHFWKWFMERQAAGRNVMLATGGAACPPSSGYPGVKWIFSTSLSQAELAHSSGGRAAPVPAAVRLIIVARQDQKKGTGSVIAALPTIQCRYPQAHLDVVGDGPSLNEFMALAKDLGVFHRVTFHGKQNHARVMELLRRADLFCYPTAASEGFPKVVLEALASGLPVLATPVSVLPQLLGEGGGLLLSDASPEALAEAIFEILEDPDRYRQASSAAVASASSRSLEAWCGEIRRACEQAWGSFS